MYYDCGCIYDSSPFSHLKGCEKHPRRKRGSFSTDEFIDIFRNQNTDRTQSDTDSLET